MENQKNIFYIADPAEGMLKFKKMTLPIFLWAS